MSEGKKKKSFSFSPEQSGPDEICRLVQNKSRINKLRRSPRERQTQTRVQQPSNTLPDFKTPTRLTRARFRSSVTEESPNNDAEFQHDIIWDQTSPATPFRNGRARRRAANVRQVDISEIVSRIAPKSRRPEEAESSLMQWIGDSAIPCTPEVQEPRTKCKSAKPNVVDDLLKLARQFDFNLNQQDGAHLQAKQQSSDNAMDEDLELFYDENHPPIPPQKETEGSLQGLQEAETNANDDDSYNDLPLMQKMEDDLDLLFDGSTQQISGRLSQGWSDRSQNRSKITQGSVAVIRNCTEADEDLITGSTNVLTITTACCNNSRHEPELAAGLGRTSDPGVAAAKLNNSKQVCGAIDFDDDWSNDDLLDDSLVFEMTQYPHLFSAPQHSSTQKQMSRNEGRGFINGSYHQQPINEVKHGGASQSPNQKLSSRKTFQLDPPISHQWNGTSGGLLCTSNLVGSAIPAEKIPQSHVLSTNKVPPVNSIANSDQHQSNISSDRPVERVEVQKPTGTAMWVAGNKSSLVSSSAPFNCVSSSLSSLRLDDTGKQKQPTTAEEGLTDITDEDLDFIFASDDIWDDGADDDNLFCEVCEKVEEFTSDLNPILETQTTTKATTTNTGGMESRTFVSPKQTNPDTTANIYPKQDDMFIRLYPPNIGTSYSNAAGKHSGLNTQSTLLTQKTLLPGAKALNCRSVPAGHTLDSVFSAAHAVTKDVSTVVTGRCSDAEIERKRQQAMERRRLRTTTSQNLQALI